MVSESWDHRITKLSFESNLFAECPDLSSDLLLSLTPGQDAVELSLAVLEVDGHAVAEHPQDQPECRTSPARFRVWFALPGVLDEGGPLGTQKKSRVVLEVDQTSRSTYWLEADQATRSTYLWTYISCVHCTSMCQSHPVIRRKINSLTLLRAPFLITRQVKLKAAQSALKKILDGAFVKQWEQWGNLNYGWSHKLIN